MITIIVILPLPIRQHFKYLVPDLMKPVIGGRVIVPFRSKKLIGIVLSIYDCIDKEILNLKYIISVLDYTSIYTNVLLNTLVWVSKYYYCPIGNIFFSILPKYLGKGKYLSKQYIIQWCISQKGFSINIDTLKNRRKQLEALLFLRKKSVLNSELKKYHLSLFILKQLRLKGLCIKKLLPNNLSNHNSIVINKKNIFLNKKMIFYIKKILTKSFFSCWLLIQSNMYTKLKFYLGLIEQVLNKKNQILIIVPYIKYINRIIYFLNLYFNVSISIIHTQLTDSQYLNDWVLIKNGSKNIIIGTRKSIFLPFFRLGLIIIFEEDNINYINNNTFRYNARDVGIFRAYKENIPVILDSDTPSLQTLYNVFCKKFFLININTKKNVHKIQYNLIKLQNEKIKYGLSVSLINKIYYFINKKKNVLLIFNELNLIFFGLMCSFCNWIAKCNICNDYYEINKHDQMMFCKYCLIKIKMPTFCKCCNLFSLTFFNFSTEYIMKIMYKIFPNISLIFLLDKKKIKQYYENFSQLSKYTPFVIFSTEDIIQNFIFSNISLIGLICIDHYFLSFNFQSIEYFSQLYINLNKVVRNIKKSVIILIQTSFSQNKDLLDLCNYGYFYLIRKIFKYRKKKLLPPWYYQIIIYSYSNSCEDSFNFLLLLNIILQIKSKKYNSIISFTGPYPYFFIKFRKDFTYYLLIEHSSRIYLHKLLNESLDMISYFSISKKVRWFIDVDLRRIKNF